MIKNLLYIILFFSFISPSFILPKSYVEVNPLTIDSGDTVTIKYNYAAIDLIEVVSPSGKIFKFDPESLNEKKIFFSNTNDKGFLSSNWNEYRVRFIKNKKIIDSSSFHLSNRNKTLFLTVYIDDIGRDGFLFEEGENWFKSIGGILNYGYQNDDEGGIALRKVVNHYRNDKYKNDFIFHHFTSAEFSGNRLLWHIYHLVQWEFIKLDIDNFLGFHIRDRYYLGFGILIFLVSIYFFFKTKKRSKWIYLGSSSLLLVILIVIIYSEKYVQDESKWIFKFHDYEWNKNALLDFRSEFNKENLNYPPVTRHTWNLPPYGMNKFYMTELGILADASFIFPNQIKHKKTNVDGIVLTKIKEYSYNWPEELTLPLPYYTNVNKELNSVWNGKEEERGIVEIPLTVDDLSSLPLDEFDKAIIDSLPNGALVSTYIHPKTDLKCTKELVEHLEKNYNVVHLSALKYTDLFHRHFPRPVIFDYENKKSYWAYLGKDEINPISETDILYLRDLNKNDIQPGLINVNDSLNSSINVIKFKDSEDALILNGYRMPPYIAVSNDENNEVILDPSYVFQSILKDDIKLYKYIN